MTLQKSFDIHKYLVRVEWPTTTSKNKTRDIINYKPNQTESYLLLGNKIYVLIEIVFARSCIAATYRSCKGPGANASKLF